jgi:hypothetical protein
MKYNWFDNPHNGTSKCMIDNSTLYVFWPNVEHDDYKWETEIGDQSINVERSYDGFNDTLELAKIDAQKAFENGH